MSSGLYTQHFGFRERPFSLSPDPDILFWSRTHKRAMAVLEYGIVTKAPLTVVTGEVGTGKTTLIQALLQSVPGETTVGLISNAQGDKGDLLRWVVHALGIEVPANPDYVTLFQLFQDFVVAEYAAGRHVALIIDEAQNLGLETLEELRMLTNINSGKDELLQIVLTGQPELRVMITQPKMRQFTQRVTASYHINPFEIADTRSYVKYRLAAVGGSGREISPQAVSLIHDKSGGIPRMINKLADLALVYAAAAGRARVTPALVKEVFRDNLVLGSEGDTYILTRRDDQLGEDP